MNTTRFWLWVIRLAILVFIVGTAVDIYCDLEWGPGATLSDHIRNWYASRPWMPWAWAFVSVLGFFHFFIQRNREA